MTKALTLLQRKPTETDSRPICKMKGTMTCLSFGLKHEMFRKDKCADIMSAATI